MMEFWFGQEAGSEVTPDLEVSTSQRRPSQRSPVCRRSPQSATREGGHVSHSHLWGTETFVNLKGL
jgi:hypothetical protein